MYDFKFADIGEGVHEGVVLKWNYKVGDKVEEGETLVVVETDKVNAELPAPVDGIITKIGAKEGETIHVGETIVVIDDGSGATEAPAEEDDASVSEGTDQGVIGEIEVSSDVMASSDESSEKAEEERPARALATPVARKLAKDLGVDINSVKGSGENGRVMKSDIEAAAGSAQESAQPASAQASTQRNVDVPKLTVPDNAETETVAISKLRKAIVKAMTVSKAVIPHTVLFDDVVVDDLVALRNELKEKAAASGVKLTYMPFVIKAVTLALKEHPWFNASFDEANDQMILKKFYNIGMAVDTKDGLIVPVIKSADRKGIYDLARELDGLATRTRERTVTLDELKGSTFTITNFGVADISYGAPIINYPEVGIIGIGKIQKKAVVIGDEIKIANVLPLSIAVDHRVIDGADAGRFLKTVKSFLADPMMLLLS
jgi:pyruvate dehydrogenase E2 component (dihydrolipoamide acetyltransferase)